jgi:pimeloyl-ACP methyl ester carboxylesterase
MFIRESGRGEAVLFLHGAPSDPEDWRFVAEKIAGSRRCLIPDLPGYLKSPALPGDNLTVVQEALLAELAAREIAEVSIVGHSLGTDRALRIALSGKVRVKRLALLGTLVDMSPEHKAAMRQNIGLLRQLPSLDVPPIHEMLLNLMVSEPFRKAHPEEAKQVIRWSQLCSGPVLADELQSAVDAPAAMPLLPSLKVPTLVRIGTLDQSTPMPYSEAVAKAIPGAQLQVVPNCGHAYFLEDREATSKAIADFLLGA